MTSWNFAFKLHTIYIRDFLSFFPSQQTLYLHTSTISAFFLVCLSFAMFILPEPPSFMMQILDSFCLSCKVLKCFLLVILDFWRGIASFKFHHWTTFRQIKGPCIQTKMRFEDFQQFGLKTISFKRTICNKILQLSRWSLNFNAIIILFIYFPSLPQLGTQVGQAFHLLECSVTQFFEVKI